VTDSNRTWVLAAHPDGMPGLETFRLEEHAIPTLAEGQVLGKSRWLSVDPYMRGRISAQANYAGGVKPGEAMQGGAVAEVVEKSIPAACQTSRHFLQCMSDAQACHLFPNLLH